MSSSALKVAIIACASASVASSRARVSARPGSCNRATSMRERSQLSGVRRSCAMLSVTWRMPPSSRSI